MSRTGATGPLSRGRFLQATGGLITGTMLAAQDPTGVFAQASQADQIKLAFTTPGGSAPYCATFDVIAKNYEKLHPNISFAKTMCGTGSQDFQQWLLARIAAGNPPDATISWVNPVSLGVRGALEPLDDLMRLSASSRVQDWPATALASCQFRNRTYGLPLTAGSYAIWYNQDWFAKKGIPTAPDKFPKTWDELRKLSKEFTHWNGDKLETAGFMPWGGEELDVTVHIWSALNGGQIYDARNSKYTIDSPSNVAMMQYFVDWLNEEYKGSMQALARAGSWSSYGTFGGSKSATPAFQANRLAAQIQGSWTLGDLYASQKPGFAMNWNLASFPVGPTGTKTTSGYWPNWLVVPKGSMHKREIFQYLDYMSITGMKAYYSNTPDLPANKNFPRGFAPSIATSKRGKEFGTQASRFFFHQLDIATPMWTSPVEFYAKDQLKKATDRILNKLAKPKDALAEAQRLCQGELDKLLKSS